MIKAIIFDCFGVLVGRGFDETYSYAGGDPKKDKQFIDEILDRANMGLMSQAEFRQSIVRKLGIEPKAYDGAVKAVERPNLTLLNYISRLRPKHKTAVLSNANLGVLERKISEEWLNRCFDVRIVSAEVGFIKPDARIYQLTAKNLGVKPQECVFIDDKSDYCEAAENVGMRTIWYQNFEQMKTELEALISPVSNN